MWMQNSVASSNKIRIRREWFLCVNFFHLNTSMSGLTGGLIGAYDPRQTPVLQDHCGRVVRMDRFWDIDISHLIVFLLRLIVDYIDVWMVHSSRSFFLVKYRGLKIFTTVSQKIWAFRWGKSRSQVVFPVKEKMRLTTKTHQFSETWLPIAQNKKIQIPGSWSYEFLDNFICGCWCSECKLLFPCSF